MLQTDSTNANGLKPPVALSPVAILSHTYIARGAWGSPTYGANPTCADYGIAPSVFFFVSCIPCEALSECVSNYELCVHHDSGFMAYVVSSSILRELLTILAFHSPTCMPYCEPRIRDRPAVNHIQPNYPKHMAPDNQLSLSNQLPRPSRTRPASFGASQEEHLLRALVLHLGNFVQPTLRASLQSRMAHTGRSAVAVRDAPVVAVPKLGSGRRDVNKHQRCLRLAVGFGAAAARKSSAAHGNPF